MRATRFDHAPWSTGYTSKTQLPYLLLRSASRRYVNALAYWFRLSYLMLRPVQ